VFAGSGERRATSMTWYRSPRLHDPRPVPRDLRMNDLLKQRIARLLDSLSDERGYQILDYLEFLDSKYAERSRPGGIFARLTETVEDTMRAGKLPIQAISGTMGLMDSAAKVMKGLAAAGQAVVEEAVRVAETASKPSQETPKLPEPPTSGSNPGS
jgi:hypothetical protein